MAVYFQTHAGLFSGEAVAAVADKRIRVRRFILTSSINQSVTLKQDVGGASDAAICCTLYARSGGSATRAGACGRRDGATSRPRPRSPRAR